MDKILAGLRKFQTEVFPHQEGFFRELRREQRPTALFITCSDSRVHPNLITQTEPGVLFILRNPGNIVPPHGQIAGGEAATIEFAMDVLEIPHIIVCGHSDCGAMKALLKRGELTSLPAVTEWLHHCEATRRVVAASADGGTDQALHAAIEHNVLTQLNHLRTHPSVASRLVMGKLQMHGWIYDIGTGAVLGYDSKQLRFIPRPEDACPITH